MNDKNSPLLSVKNLTIHYITDDGIVKAVNDISFDLEKGKSMGLVGETGAGKTTTALGIMELIPDPPGKIISGEILVNGKDSYISLPLKKDSDHLDVRDRYLADSWSFEKHKMLNRIIASYRKAPCFDSAYPVIERSILFEESNLCSFILNSLNLVR